MIAAVEGTLELRSTDSVIIRVGGISFQVYLPASSIDELGPVGKQVQLHTLLHWKEDRVVLYGFLTQEGREFFKMLTSVSGIGPKLAMAMLSSLNPEGLASAIMSSDIDLLTQVPGVGKKTASRVVLELKSKLEKGWGGLVVSYHPTGDSDKIITALTSLGYSAADATRAIAALSTSADLSLEDKIKLALRNLAR
ncbi:MAG: Holliday junction branch migration protein RuvA [Chloroflexi bacterium]|nr:Holliday junction branch migration protein RuvA [Chloroflexota bacterium]